MRTLSTMMMALTFAASAASAETATQAPAQARVPKQAQRSAPAPKPAAPKATAPKAAPVAPRVTSAAPASPTTAAAPAVTASEPATATAASTETAPATEAAAPCHDAAASTADATATTASVAAPATTDAATTAPATSTDATPAPATTSAPADEADDVEEHVAEPAVKIPLPAKAPTPTALTVEYQRVGRDILKLQDQRGKFDCGNLAQRFKAIKLDTALATPAARMQLYVTLAELSLKLERMRGIKIDSACLANPLAPGCM